MQGSLDPRVQSSEALADQAPGRVGGRRSDVLRWVGAVIVTAAAFVAGTAIAFMITHSGWPDRSHAGGQRLLQRIFSFLRRSLTRLGVVEVDTRALESLQAEPPLILVPNHPSILDAPVVISCFPNVCCIMKRALLDRTFTGVGARLAGYVDNGSLTSLVRRSIAAVHGGAHLLVFPEGTRSDRVPVGPFTRAYALIARKAGVPMQTLLIETDSPYGTKGWALWRRPPALPIRIRIRQGRRFSAGADVDQVVKEMQAYFERVLGEKVLNERGVSERGVGDRASGERQSSEREVSEREVSERALSARTER